MVWRFNGRRIMYMKLFKGNEASLPMEMWYVKVKINDLICVVSGRPTIFENLVQT